MRRVAEISLALLLVSCAAGGGTPQGSGGNGGAPTTSSASSSSATSASSSSASSSASSSSSASGGGAGGTTSASSSGGGAGGAGGSASSSTSASSTTSASSASSASSGGPVAIGLYTYTAVPAYALLDPPAAAWHPNGQYALVLNTKDTVFKYDPVTHALTQVASVGPSVVWRAIAFAPGGGKAVLLGNVSSPVEARIYLWDDASAQLTQMTTDTFAGGTYESIAWSPDGTKARLLGSKPNAGSYLAYLWAFDVAAGRSDVKAKPTSAGCQDLAWATDAFDAPAAAVTCGVNGVTLFHLDGGGNLVDYTLNAGNTSRISGRPQGDYALAIGWSGQRVYRFQQGMWSTGFGQPTFPGIFQVGFASDGARALILGGTFGSPAVGQVYEFRHDLYTQGGITDVSIPNFGLPPYNASSQAALHDVAWRPGCDGGIIVGGANTFSSQQAFVIRFSVDNGVACPN